MRLEILGELIMNGLSAYGKTVSYGVSLTGSILGAGYLALSSAHPDLNLCHASIPSQNVTPTLEKLSDSEWGTSKQLTALSNATITQPEYTQAQLESAESNGVDPSECDEDGHLIENKISHFALRWAEPSKSQEACMNTFDVGFNRFGVYTNRTTPISAAILKYSFTPDNWNDIEMQHLDSIRRLNIFLDQDTELKIMDFQGFKQLYYFTLYGNTNSAAYKITMPRNLDRFVESFQYLITTENNQVFIPEDLVRRMIQSNPEAGLGYTDKELQSSGFEIELGDSTIHSSEIKFFFENGFSPTAGVHYISLSNPDINLSLPVLTSQQKLFLCTYLRKQVEESGYLAEESSIKDVSDCENLKTNQEICANTLNVPLSSCTLDGVFLDPDKIVTNPI